MKVRAFGTFPGPSTEAKIWCLPWINIC